MVGMDLKKILVVEDSERLNDFIKVQLARNKYCVTQALNGKEAYEALKTSSFDLVILDLKLGDVDGLTILKTIRLQNKQIPVMIISSISDDHTKIEGFRIGCDDYLTKPFMSGEMLMRVRRMLERSELINVTPLPIQEIIESGPFKLNVGMQTVTKNDVDIPMRKKYFDILLFFVRHPNVAIPYRTLYEGIWNNSAEDSASVESSLYVNINNLRKLIEDEGGPKVIQSVRKVGYMYSVPEDQTGLSTLIDDGTEEIFDFDDGLPMEDVSSDTVEE